MTHPISDYTIRLRARTGGGYVAAIPELSLFAEGASAAEACERLEQTFAETTAQASRAGLADWLPEPRDRLPQADRRGLRRLAAAAGIVVLAVIIVTWAGIAAVDRILVARVLALGDRIDPRLAVQAAVSAVPKLSRYVAEMPPEQKAETLAAFQTLMRELAPYLAAYHAAAQQAAPSQPAPAGSGTTR